MVIRPRAVVGEPPSTDRSHADAFAASAQAASMSSSTIQRSSREPTKPRMSAAPVTPIEYQRRMKPADSSAQ
jgi:hypothetical protein